MNIKQLDISAFDSQDLMYFMEGILDDVEENKSGKEMFNEILTFFEEVFDRLIKDEIDLVVLMTRKAWCLYNAFEIFLYREGFGSNSRAMAFPREEYEAKKNRVTHDAMIATVLNNTELTMKPRSEIRIALVDDTCVRGNAIRKCASRLIKALGITPLNIHAYFYISHDEAVKRGDLLFDETGHTPRLKLKSKDDVIEIAWGRKKQPSMLGILKSIDDIKHYSSKFVEIIHATSTPYVALSCGFLFDIDWGNRIMGTLEGPSGYYLIQDDLAAPFNDPSIFAFHNITCSAMYKNSVEAFVLTPKDSGKDESCLPEFLPGDDSVKAFRFYINRALGKFLIVPYVQPLDTCVRITELLPKNIGMFREYEDAIDRNILEGELAAYRALCFSSSYLLGKKFIEKFGGDAICYLRPMSGLRSNDYIEWLESDDAKQWLGEVFALLKNEKNQNTLEFESEASKTEFEKTLNETFADFKEDTGYFYNTTFTLFRKHKEKTDCAIPVNALWKMLKTKFNALMHEKFTATILYLHDVGAMPIFIAQNGSVIGHSSASGELSFADIYEAELSYAFFLQRLRDRCDSVENSDFEIIKKRVKTYFETKIKEGELLLLSLAVLLKPIDDILMWKNECDTDKRALQKDNLVYSSERYPTISDSNAEFFFRLADEYSLTS